MTCDLVGLKEGLAHDMYDEQAFMCMVYDALGLELSVTVGRGIKSWLDGKIDVNLMYGCKFEKKKHQFQWI